LTFPPSSCTQPICPLLSGGFVHQRSSLFSPLPPHTPFVFSFVWSLFTMPFSGGFLPPFPYATFRFTRPFPSLPSVPPPPTFPRQNFLSVNTSPFFFFCPVPFFGRPNAELWALVPLAPLSGPPPKGTCVLFSQGVFVRHCLFFWLADRGVGHKGTQAYDLPGPPLPFFFLSCFCGGSFFLLRKQLSTFPLTPYLTELRRFSLNSFSGGFNVFLFFLSPPPFPRTGCGHILFLHDLPWNPFFLGTDRPSNLFCVWFGGFFLGFFPLQGFSLLFFFCHFGKKSFPWSFLYVLLSTNDLLTTRAIFSTDWWTEVLRSGNGELW